MIYKLGTAFLLFILSQSAFAEEYTYLVQAQVDVNSTIRGAAYTYSDRVEVNGFVVLDQNPRTGFEGVWTRSGKIEAVDDYGNMYLFDVIRLLNDKQARSFAYRF